MKNLMCCGIFAAALATLCPGCAPSTADLRAVGDFVPERYMGTWYEIARLPHRFERGLDEVRAEYTLNPDGSIKVVNSGVRDGEARSIVGRARLKEPNMIPLTGELEVSFFRPFYGDYRIIELDPEYSVAVVTGSTRDYLWILARKPELDKTQLDALLKRLAGWNFAVDKLEFPHQTVPGK